MLKTEKKNPWWLDWLFPIGIGFLITTISLYAWTFWAPLSSDQAHWGQFGDYVGGILNPILGLLTLFVLIRAFLLQKEELRATVEELENSTNAMKEQGLTLQKQTFENTLFQMLQLHNNRVESLEITVDYVVKQFKVGGRDAFKQLVEQLTYYFKNTGKVTDLDQLEIAYNKFYEEYQHSIGHYFRFLYNIFKFIDQSDVPNKKFYANLVRAQLSTQELILLFYNCLTPWGREKFKPLIEKYALLKTLPRKDFAGSALIGKYDDSAYNTPLSGT